MISWRSIYKILQKFKNLNKWNKTKMNTAMKRKNDLSSQLKNVYENNKLLYLLKIALFKKI